MNRGIVLCFVMALFVGTASSETLTGDYRIVDADTIDIDGVRVRLSGIDAPEKWQRCRDARGECYLCGQAATDALRYRIGFGDVRCEILPERDRYGRAIGSCYSEDGADLQEWLVLNGHALAYRKYSVRYVAEESIAEANGAGIHGGEFIAPWDWRRQVRLNPRCK